MEDWKARVFEEKRELDLKIEKLEAWLRNSDDTLKVGIDQVRIMHDQLRAMKAYSRALSRRLPAF